MLFFLFLPPHALFANHGHPEEPAGAEKPTDTEFLEKPAIPEKSAVLEKPAVPEKAAKEQLFSIGINVVPKLQNADLSGTPVEDKIDKSAYAYQFNYAFPSEKKNRL